VVDGRQGKIIGLLREGEKELVAIRLIQIRREENVS